MLKKTFTLALFLILVTFVVSLALNIFLAVFGLKNVDGLFIPVSIISGFYVGQIYTKRHREEIPKDDKIKVSIYYFLFQMLLAFMTIAIIHNSKLISTMVIVSISINICASIFIYRFLGIGCETKLKLLRKNES